VSGIAEFRRTGQSPPHQLFPALGSLEKISFSMTVSVGGPCQLLTHPKLWLSTKYIYETLTGYVRGSIPINSKKKLLAPIPSDESVSSPRTCLNCPQSYFVQPEASAYKPEPKRRHGRFKSISVHRYPYSYRASYSREDKHYVSIRKFFIF
jgi:hypothetical protein